VKRFAPLLALLAALPAAPADAQMAPGLRAPTSIAEGAGDAFLEGCYFATTGRPSAGLNVDISLAGAGVHAPDRIPDELRPLIDTLADHVGVITLDAPGGKIWIFFDPEVDRCMIVPQPVTAEGVEGALQSMVQRDWRPVTREGGGAAFEQDFEGNAMIGARAGTLRAWYQPAQGPASPQMIVVERLRQSGNGK